MDIKMYEKIALLILKLTGILKRLMQLSLNENGMIFVKSYFDPAMEKDIRKTNFKSKIKKEVQKIISYTNYEKISCLTGYSFK